jgi:hypothetical protein
MKIFDNLRNKREKELRDIVFKKYFSSAKHKKIIMEAAKKSAEDQKALSVRYEKMIAGA